MSFGDHLKKTLDDMNISQRKFAAMIGKDPTYISRVINGSVNVSWEMIQLCAEALEISPAYFFMNKTEDMVRFAMQDLSPELKDFIKSRPNGPWLVLAKDLSETDLTPDQVKKVVELWEETVRNNKL